MNPLLNRLRNSQLGLWQTLVFVFNKVFFASIRGILIFGFNRNVSKPIFVGSCARVLHKGRLFSGRYCYIGDFSYINCASIHGVQLGERVTIREFAWLQLTSTPENPGSKIVVGDGTYIGPRANLGGAADLIIGSRCQFGAGVNFIAESHKYSDDSTIFEQGVTRKGIVIGDDCWFGNNVTILDGVTIGSGCVVGANSLVNKSFGANSVIVGSPAKLLKSRVGC